MMDSIPDAIHYLFYAGDKRIDALPFTNLRLPFYTLCIYVLLVKVIGPKFMENRPPYVLKRALLVYNAFQVALSAYIFFMFTHQGWFSLSKWFTCTPIADPDDPDSQYFVLANYLYYISKYTELLDTVFFVLRKKYNQVSFLHVYHHGGMPFFTCITVRFAPGSSVGAVAFLNSFVHVIMYGYYMLAALGPQVQKHLWWKKYITSLQLIQFITLFLHFLIVLPSSCNIPKGLVIFFLANTFFNFALFYLFYRREYKQKMIAKKSAVELNGTAINGTPNNVKHEVTTNGFQENNINVKLSTTAKEIKYRGHS